MNQSDAAIEELIQRARQGDREALGDILDQQRPYLRAMTERQITGKLAARLDASDVIQQTLLSVYGNFNRFEGNGAAELQAWLGQVHKQNVQNVVRDHTRAQKRAVGREQSLDAGPESLPQANQTTASQRAIRREEADHLVELLEQLSEDQREVVRLRYLAGWSLAQIGEHMHRTEAAVIGLLKRGMQNLRKHIGHDQ
jgi:RNA polymerase sigma-70 factor (ECF subfamily)